MDNPIAEAYVKMLQERVKKEDKMDPVGQGDADIDNDGDVDSSDEYLHKRRKAIKKSLKKEENENYVSAAQRKAVHANKADNGKGHPDNKKESADELDEKGPKIKKTLAQVSVKGISKRANNMARTGKTEEVGIDESVDIMMTDGPLIAQIFAEAKGRKLSPDDIRKALASKKAQAKPKGKVSLKKAPWESKTEAVDIETDDAKTDVDDPKVKKKSGEKKSGKGDPAAVNAPSQDDRQAAADAPDPSPDPDAEPTPPKEKEAPAPKKDKIAVKKKSGMNGAEESVKEAKSNPIEFMDDDKSAISGLAKKAGVKANFIKGNHHSHDGRVEYVGSTANIKKALIAHHGDKETAAEEHPKMFKESFNWNEISEMNDEQVDAYIDSLDESQLDAFELEMNEAANPEGEADQQDKEQANFIMKHRGGKVVDRPDADKPKDGTKAAPKRPGDKADGDKKPVKTMKDIRK